MYKKLTLAVLTALSTMALADINVGVSLSATGPAASLGIPEKNTIALLPTTIGGQKVNYIVLDDATDPTAATKNIKKLIGENKVDVVIGSTTTPNSLAMMDVAVDNETPLISMAGSAIVVEPMDAKRQWVFKTAQNDAHMATALVQHMTDKNVQTVAFIGFADAYGEGWFKEFAKIAEARKLKVVASERFQRNDHLGDRPDSQDHGRQAGCRTGRRCRHAGCAAPEGAQGKRLQGPDLPDPRRRQQRLPARRWQGCRRRFPAGRPDGCCRPVAE